MSLVTEVSKAFLRDVFHSRKMKKGRRVLVVDEESATLLSSCLRMQDIMDTGVIHRLIGDLTSVPTQYSSAYVYFTIACPSQTLQRIATSGCMPLLKALEQLNIGFLPLETHVFSVPCKDTPILYSCPIDRVPDRGLRLERMAEQIATTCVLLNEYPKIRYRKRPENLELARLVQMKLDQQKSDNPSMGQGTYKGQSILLLLDRGTDPLTPLLHDLTLEALLHDLVKIEDNIYRYGNGQEFELTDQDKLWKDLRHEHIADVTRTLPSLVRQFAESKKHFLSSKEAASMSSSPNSTLSQDSAGEVNLAAETGSDTGRSHDASLRALQTMVREMPQYQREAASYNALVSIADTCLSACRNSVNKMCAVEQNLVMGQTAEGEALHDPMRSLVEVLSPDTMTELERFRLVVIFILSRSGISEAHLDKLLDYARLSLAYKSIIAALSSVLGARLINASGSTFDSPLLRNLPDLSSAPAALQFYLPCKGKRVNRVDDNCYALSRWSPYLEDLLEKCIADTLDSQHFPFLLGANSSDLRGLGQFGNSLQPPSDRASGGRGPSARFRAPSPSPGGSVDSNGAGAGGSGFSSASGSGSTRHHKTASLTPGIGDELTSMSDHYGPRLIVFVVGGVTWPEARICYSITQRCLETRLTHTDRSTSPNTTVTTSRRLGGAAPTPSHILPNGGGTGWNWEVILGGTEMLTAEKFFNNLKYLADY
ncbi:Syntaxin-binding protein 1 [Sparganum proliferum]